MATNTADARVGSGLIGSELGLHYRVTGLAAEIYRLGIFVAAITAEGAGRNKNKSNNQKNEEGAARTRIVQIQSRISRVFCRRGAMPPPPLDYSPGNHHAQTEDQNRGKNDVGENSEIRILGFRSNFNQEEQDD